MAKKTRTENKPAQTARSLLAAKTAPAAKKSAPAKRTANHGKDISPLTQWLVMGAIFLLVAWELLQAAWSGRMDDILFDGDNLYFFDDPILFVIQAGLFAAIVAGIAYAGFRRIRSALK